MEPLVLRGEGLSLEAAVEAASAPDARIAVAPEAMERVAASRAVVDRAVASDQPVYGVTTGFGKLQNRAIPADDREVLQRNLVLSHSAGVGPALSAEEARLVLLLRVQSLIRGHSGVTTALVGRLVDLFNSGIAPFVPEQGSVGASGDLAPLAHVALAVIGEGEVLLAGRRVPAAEALRRQGLAPEWRLREKEGLALLNGTQMMTAIAARNVVRAEALLRHADLACALSLDALCFSVRPFDARVQETRPHPGQAVVAANVRALLEGSTILPSHAGPHKVQDAYSVRCAPQVHGACRDALRYVREVVEREVNSTTDNPLVFAEDGAVVSGGNFHGEPVALASDHLALLAAEIASISERRIENLVNPDLSGGLPAFLAREPGVQSGMMIAQVTAAALVSENKSLSHPASVDSIPTSANQEDHVSMGPIAARKARSIVRNSERVLGIEILCAVEGLEFRRPLRTGRALESAIAVLRERLPRSSGDHILSRDFEAVDELLRSGALLRAAAQAGAKVA